MRSFARAVLMGLALAIAAPVGAADESATMIQKELHPKWKKAQAEGKDLGEAGEHYKAGQEAMRNGLQEEALEHFKKARDTWPAD